MFMILVEFFQYICTGPNFKSLSATLHSISIILAVDIGQAIESGGDSYWIVLFIVYSICFVWTLLGIILVLKLDFRFPKSHFWRSFGFYGENLLHIPGNITFIPILSILLDLFICDEAIGPNFSDSFIYRDCNVFCWEGEHIVFVTVALICIFVYFPFAIYTRPLW